MKIVSLLNEGKAVKSGIGKNNKPWEMFEVELESGDTATLFGPIKIGTEVETFEHETYGLQYRVKRANPMDDIKKQLDDLTKMVKWLVQQQRSKAAPEAVRPKAIAANEGPDEPEEESDGLDGLFND